MNILMVGNGKGSFQIRAVQLGARLGARVRTSPTSDDWAWADIIVLIKNYGAQFAREAWRVGKPVVWDALDFWRQPFDNLADEPKARLLLADAIARVRPALTIGATEAMAMACGGAYLPHHSWKGLEPVAPQDDATTVVYEGNPVYLGRWKAALEEACLRRRWRFVVNPPELWHGDIVVALRDREWDGWMCREWKSGVKLANAIAAGRPVLCQPTAAYRELKPIGVAVDEVPSAAVAEWALESLMAPDLRAWAYDTAQQHAKTLRLAAVADRYRAILEGVLCRS